jgi:UrcA family protein
MSQKVIFGGLAASSLLIASSALLAQSPFDEIRHSTGVDYSDIRFSQTADVATLYDRISFAAQQVCGPRSETGSYSMSPDYARCYTAAVQNAVADIDRAPLTAYYQQQLSTPESRDIRLAEK